MAMKKEDFLCEVEFELAKRFYPWLLDKARDCSSESDVDADGVQVSSDLDASGKELPDPTPLAPPVGMSSGPSLADFVQRMIRMEAARAAELAGYENFDEAEDFDVDDDVPDPLTPYEEYFDPRVKMSSYQEGYKAAVEEFMKKGGGGVQPPSDKPVSEPASASQAPPKEPPGSAKP